MADLGSIGRKKSLFPTSTTVLSGASVDFFSAGVNYQISYDNFLTGLGVTGTLVQDGDPAGTPILDAQGTVNNIRNLEDGSGIKASISPQNGITLEHNFTQGTGGVPILINPTATSPIIGSIIAGSGISVAATGQGAQISLSSTPASSSTVIVNTMSDFPAAISGVRELVGSTEYFITADLTTSDRFNVSQGNIVIRAPDSSIASLTYTGTGDLFTGVNVSFRIGRITLSAVNGRVWNLSDTTGNAVFQFIDGTISSCNKVGIFSGSSFGSIQLNNLAMLGIITDGVEFNGNFAAFLSLINIGVITAGSVFNLGSSTFGLINIDSNIITLNAGTSLMSGLTASGNIQANGLGTIVNTRISGAGTPLVNITSDDDRWAFLLNDEIRDTRTDGMLALETNVTETVIAIMDTPVKVNSGSTWTDEGSSRFTSDTTGRSTYSGPKDVRLPITISSTSVMASGGAKDISLYVAINGAIVAKSGAHFSVSTAPERATLTWQYTFSPGDYVELWVENNSDTTNIIVTDSVLRVN